MEAFDAQMDHYPTDATDAGTPGSAAPYAPPTSSGITLPGSDLIGALMTQQGANGPGPWLRDLPGQRYPLPDRCQVGERGGGVQVRRQPSGGASANSFCCRLRKRQLSKARAGQVGPSRCLEGRMTRAGRWPPPVPPRLSGSAASRPARAITLLQTVPRPRSSRDVSRT